MSASTYRYTFIGYDVNGKLYDTPSLIVYRVLTEAALNTEEGPKDKKKASAWKAMMEVINGLGSLEYQHFPPDTEGKSITILNPKGGYFDLSEQAHEILREILDKFIEKYFTYKHAREKVALDNFFDKFVVDLSLDNEAKDGSPKQVIGEIKP